MTRDRAFLNATRWTPAVATWWICACAATALSGCSGKVQTEFDLLVIQDGSFMGDTELSAEKGELHQAVYEMIFARTDLPFGFGGHGGPQRERNRAMAAAIAPKANELLKTRGSLHMYGGGAAIGIVVSARSRTLAVSWLADRGEDGTSFFVDLSGVEGAFDPAAPLDVEQVERAAIVLRGGE